MSSSPTRRKLLWTLVVVLGILHYDFWWWDSRELVFGFLPVALAFHAGFSVVAGLVWALATRWAWPGELEAWASGGEDA